MKKPTHAQGWNFKGAVGQFHIWHAGKNDYRITKGSDGEIVAARDQFGLAYSKAAHLWQCRKAGL